MLWVPPEFSQVLTLLTAKAFSETATISSEYRDFCKSRFWCTLMVVLKRIYTAFLRDHWKNLVSEINIKNTETRAGSIHKQGRIKGSGFMQW